MFFKSPCEKNERTSYSLLGNICKSHIQQRTRSYLYRELSQLNMKKVNAPIRKWAKDMNGSFTEENIPSGKQAYE